MNTNNKGTKLNKSDKIEYHGINTFHFKVFYNLAKQYCHNDMQKLHKMTRNFLLGFQHTGYQYNHSKT